MNYIKIGTNSTNTHYVVMPSDKLVLLDKVYLFNAKGNIVLTELPLIGNVSMVINNGWMPLKQRKKVNTTRYEAFIVFSKDPNRYNLYIPCNSSNLYEIGWFGDDICLSINNVLEFKSDVTFNAKGYKYYSFYKDKNKLNFLVKVDPFRRHF